MEDIMKNEELMKKLAAVQTEAELIKVLEENEIALEDGVTAKQFLAAMNGEASDELDADDLDAVAGGILLGPTYPRNLVKLGVKIAVYIYSKWKK